MLLLLFADYFFQTNLKKKSFRSDHLICMVCMCVCGGDYFCVPGYGFLCAPEHGFLFLCDTVLDYFSLRIPHDFLYIYIYIYMDNDWEMDPRIMSLFFKLF